MLKCVFGLMAALAAGGALAAASATPLDAYLDNLKTLRAQFVQTVTDAHGRLVDRSTGTLVVVRPGKLRWEIQPEPAAEHAEDRPAGGQPSGPAASGHSEAAPGGQLLVADGRNLWFLDRDLQQVTVKPADAALSATPAMLLSGATDLRSHFNITPAGKRDGLEWVLVEPQGSKGDFRRALFGFQGPQLHKMILEDKLGQTATVTFQKIERNVPVDPKEVSFTPPPGVDVIGTPRQ